MRRGIAMSAGVTAPSGRCASALRTPGRRGAVPYRGRCGVRCVCGGYSAFGRCASAQRTPGRRGAAPYITGERRAAGPTWGLVRSAVFRAGRDLSGVDDGQKPFFGSTRGITFPPARCTADHLPRHCREGALFFPSIPSAEPPRGRRRAEYHAWARRSGGRQGQEGREPASLLIARGPAPTRGD